MLLNMELFKDLCCIFVREEILEYKIRICGIDFLSNVEILFLVIGDGFYGDIEKVWVLINESENFYLLKVQSEDFWCRIFGVGVKKVRVIVVMSIF